MTTIKEVIIQKTNKEVGKSFMIRAEDTCAGGGHQSVPSALGKTWAYQFKKANRPKKNVETV